MYKELAFALAVLLASSLANSQQPMPATASPAANLQAVFYAGPGVTAPQILAPEVSISRPKHCDELNGVVKLSAVVESNGIPRNIKALYSDDARLDNFAAGFIAAQQFKAGTHNGTAAAVAIEMTVGLHVCAPRMKAAGKQDSNQLILLAHPIIAMDIAPSPKKWIEASKRTPVLASQAARGNISSFYQVGGKISAPVPIFEPDPQYPDSAKQNKITGSCLLKVIIDTNGVPQNVHVVRSTDASLEHSSVEALRAWRFKPALKDGVTPVPVEVAIATVFMPYKNYFIAYAAFDPISPDETLAAAVAPGIKSNVHPPVPLNLDEVAAGRSPVPDSKRVHGDCILAMFVDANGVPHNVRVLKGVEPALDDDLVGTLQQLHFKPAMKDGTTPVGVNLLMAIPVHVHTVYTTPSLKSFVFDALLAALELKIL